MRELYMSSNIKYTLKIMICLYFIASLTSCEDANDRRMKKDTEELRKAEAAMEKQWKKDKARFEFETQVKKYDKVIKSWGIKKESKKNNADIKITQEIKKVLDRLENETIYQRCKSYLELDKLKYEGLTSLFLKEINNYKDLAIQNCLVKIKSNLNNDLIILRLAEELKKKKKNFNIMYCICFYFDRKQILLRLLPDEGNPQCGSRVGLCGCFPYPRLTQRRGQNPI